MGKKLKLIVFGLLLFIVIGFVASRPNNADYRKMEILSVGSLDKRAQGKVLSSVTKKDTDKDGLKDWEEVLWETDPKNKDTDGDGKEDGDEINSNTNPLIAGPEDGMSEDVLIKYRDDDAISGEGVELTATDKFAEDFFKEYLSLKKSGEPLDALAKDFLIDSATNDLSISSKQNLNYSIQDIKILKDDNDETVRAYGNIIVETVQKYAKLNSEDELSVFEKALRYEDPELLESLQGSVLMYRSLADDFVSISVPGGLVSVHLDIINGYENIADSLENMVKIFEDPILSAVGVNSYVIAVDSQVALTVPIQEYFLDRNIVFNPGEAGAVWNIF